MKILPLFRKNYLPIAWMIIMHILLLMPSGKMPKEEFPLIPNFDKLVHFGIYFALTAAWVFYLSNQAGLKARQLTSWTILLPILAIADGIAVEFLQKLPVIHRDFDWFDALADGIGAISGTFLARYFTARWRAKEKPL